MHQKGTHYVSVVMYTISLKAVCNMCQICTVYVSSMYAIIIKHVHTLYPICTQYVSNMYTLCTYHREALFYLLYSTLKYTFPMMHIVQYIFYVLNMYTMHSLIIIAYMYDTYIVQL